MLKSFVTLAVCLTWCVLAAADEPPPKPAPPTIKAPKEVSGTGTKSDPYVFTKSTRCILELVGELPDPKVLKWDQDDAPSDLQILADRYASFSLYETGLHQLTAHGGEIYSKVWFSINSGTDPPPGPGPVDPIPDPSAVGKLWVVIVKDNTKLTSYPSSQMAALMSTTIREYCNSHCLPGTDGKTPEFKIYDKDTDVSKQSPAVQKAFKTALDDLAKSGGNGPWITISNGKTGYSGPFPLTEAAALDKLKTYGGQ